MKIIATLEVITGISLILKKYVQLSLIIITVVIINAVIFHLLHDPRGITPAIIATIIISINIYFYRSQFKKLLSA